MIDEPERRSAAAPPRAAHGEGPGSRALRVGILGFVVVILLSVGGAFVGLDASSMWVDELYTAYFADPDQPSLRAVLLRAARDTHPPGYYLSVYLVTQLGGEFAVAARAFSAAMAVLALGILYLALPRGAGRFERLFVCAFAATSDLWFYQAQDARAYSLCFVFAAVFLYLGVRILGARRDGDLPWGRLAALGVAGVLAGLTHFYLLYLAAGVLGALILLAVTWRQRIGLVACGLAIPPAALAYLAWQSQFKTSGRAGLEWLSNEPRELFYHTATGIWQIFGPVGALFIAWAVAAYAVVNRTRIRPSRGSAAFFDVYAFILLSCLIAVSLALLMSFLVVPSYQHKLYFVLAPFAWTFFGLVAAEAARGSRRTGLTVGIMLAFLVVSSVKLLWRDVPIKQEWRASAEFVASRPGCEGAVLPVIEVGASVIPEGEQARFHGYYLDGPERAELLPIPQRRVSEALRGDPLMSLLRARIAGRDDCPVLLWSVHRMDRAEAEAFAREVGARFDVPPGREIRVHNILPAAMRPGPFAMTLHNPRKTFVVTVGEGNRG